MKDIENQLKTIQAKQALLMPLTQEEQALLTLYGNLLDDKQ